MGLGAVAVGALTWGGMGIGGMATGAVAIGYHAIGGVALAWEGAIGSVAVAREFALGCAAHAAEANTEAARALVEGKPLFTVALALAHWCWLMLIFVAPLVLFLSCWPGRARNRKQA